MILQKHNFNHNFKYDSKDKRKKYGYACRLDGDCRILSSHYKK